MDDFSAHKNQITNAAVANSCLKIKQSMQRKCMFISNESDRCNYFVKIKLMI